MRGHGTVMTEDSTLQSTVAGVVQRVNKLISVKPLKTRYNGDIGDVVIGRITEVGMKRWKVECGARLDSILHLSSVNLPGGELRRKSAEDEAMMRDYLQEGDLVSAEVQQVHQDGVLSLHTRSLKYGKLGQGILLKVSPSLVQRRKTHFHNLPCGASVIFGCNGYIWLSQTPTQEEEGGGFVQNFEPVAKADREVITRLRNSVELLARFRLLLHDTNLLLTYEASLPYKIQDLLRPEISKTVMQEVRAKVEEMYS